jgi:hypothetical protein
LTSKKTNLTTKGEEDETYLFFFHLRSKISVNYASSEQSQAVNTTPDSNIDKQNKHCRLEKKHIYFRI